MIYRIDDAPSKTEIRQVLTAFNDSRVEYDEAERETGSKVRKRVYRHNASQTYCDFLVHVSQYSPADAGYTITDKYLQRALKRPECQWISVTTSDNAYGSEVVQNILREPSDADYIFNPIDSRRFQQRGICCYVNSALWRNTLNILLFGCIIPPYLHLHNLSVIDIIQRNATYCSFLSHIKIDGLTYATEPKATGTGGQLDLSVAFLRREKLLQENILFGLFDILVYCGTWSVNSCCFLLSGDFSDRSKFPCLDTAVDSTDPPGYLCLNAQGVHLLHHLAQQQQQQQQHRRWTMARLTADGLRYVVFHGNSPTLCIGAGNTWLDHPDPTQRRCMTGRDTFDFIVNPRLQEFRFDVKHFKRQGQIIGLCMREKEMVKVQCSSR